MSHTKVLIDIGVLIVNFLLMFTVGMELTPQHFREVARQKGRFFCLFAGQVVVLPLLAFLLVRIMPLPVHISAGILLLAACPVGDIANFYTLLGRGNAALSVMMNTVTCMMSMVTMAITFQAYQVLMGETFGYAVPAFAVVVRLTLMVAVPVIAGMAVCRFRPGWRPRCAKPLRNASFAGVGFLLVYVIVTQHRLLVSDWSLTALSGAVFMVAALMAGMAAGRLLQLPMDDILTCGVVYSVRNVALSMAIAVTLLNRVEYAVFAVVYFLTEVPLLLGVVAWYRRYRSRWT